MVYLRSLSCSDALAPHRIPRDEILRLLISRITGKLAPTTRLYRLPRLPGPEKAESKDLALLSESPA